MLFCPLHYKRFTARQDTFGEIPLSDDYNVAQNIVEKFNKLRVRHFASNRELQEDLYLLMKDEIGAAPWKSRTINALPNSVRDAKLAAETDIANLYQPQAIRDIDYLRKHGKCMDNIRAGKSTLPSGQGGRGAFATRFLPKGTIVTGTPLHHIPYKELVTIFRMEKNHSEHAPGKETWLRFVDEVRSYQIVLNYCYGHQQSTMLLCPYGAGVNYINHNKTQANVKIQWAEHGMTSHNETWLERSLESFEWEYDTGLAFDYVAMGDIRKGDELFLDYGDVFEEAITAYMSTFRPDVRTGSLVSSSFSRDYVGAEQYNKRVAGASLRSEEEQLLDPYPENLEIHCHSNLLTRKKLGKNSSDELTEFIWDHREVGFPCRILERADHNTTDAGDTAEVKTRETFVEPNYKVEFKISLEELGIADNTDTFTFIQRKNVPRSAIAFFNVPYSTDLHLRHTFRSEIGIPDDIFPLQWKNAKKVWNPFRKSP